MKKIILLITISFFSKLIFAQGGPAGAAGGAILEFASKLELNYKRIFPANDSMKKIYDQGGGIEIAWGIPLKKGFIIMASGGIDKVKTKSGAKDGSVWFTGGLRKDFALFTLKAKHSNEKDITTLFFVVNYGKSLSDYNARVSSVDGFKTDLFNTGVGIAFLGAFEIAYNYNNFKDIKHNSWQAMHQIKFGLYLDLKKGANKK